MTDQPSNHQAILTELRAVSAKRLAEISGPDKRSELQFWSAGGRVVLLQLFRDGSVEIFRPIDDSNSMAATLDALRSYIHQTGKP